MKNLIILYCCLFFVNSYGQNFGEQQVISMEVTNNTNVFAIDINGDTTIDVFTFSSIDNKLVWFNNTDGLGTFGSEEIINDSLILPRDAFLADIDDDGDIDVVVVSRNPEYVKKLAWYENIDGLGTFGEEQIISVDDFDFLSLSTADIDNDGDIDIFASVFKKLIWFENMDGQGSFNSGIIISDSEDGFKYLYNYPVDIDGDNDIDIISASYYDEIIWYENTDGQGTFGVENIITINNLDIVKDIFAADLDGDGDMDVLSASRNDGKIAWYENTDGLGTFGEQQLISGPEEQYAFSVVAADIDNDGDMDVISGRGDDFVSWYENTDGMGNFSEATIISTEVDGVTSVFAVDINNDGYIDVLSASFFDNKIAWYENMGELSINEFDKTNINIYPNPVKNTLQISIENNITIKYIQVFDVVGKLLLQTNSTNQLDVSAFASGLLFVKIATDKGVVVKKIIKE